MIHALKSVANRFSQCQMPLFSSSHEGFYILILFPPCTIFDFEDIQDVDKDVNGDVFLAFGQFNRIKLLKEDFYCPKEIAFLKEAGLHKMTESDDAQFLVF